MPAATTPSVTVRGLSPGDSLEALTALLHRAYARQVGMGLRPLAGRQSVEVTRQRVASGECYVAVLAEAEGAARGATAGGEPPGALRAADDRLVGAILFQEQEEAAFPEWFQRPEVGHFSLFAVDPGVQGRGIGGLLLAHVEDRARALGLRELSLSMAEPDAALRAFYDHRGFRFIQHWQWPYTNYRSAILSKALRGPRAG